MYNLDQQISEWRKQMLAAGIKTPVPLEELESHLRDEIEQQSKDGRGEAEAFAAAVRRMGQPGSLRIEFRKNSPLHEFLSKRRTVKFDLSLTRLVGLLWLCLSAPVSVKVGSEMFARHYFDPKTVLVFAVFWAGVVGGMLLLADWRWGRTLVRMNALFWTVMPLALWVLLNYFAGPGPGIDAGRSHVSFGEILTSPGGLFIALGLVSILILHLPEKANLKTTVRI